MFGDYGEDDVGGLFGIAAFRLPVGCTTDQVFQDVVHDLLGVFFCEDEYFCADVLAVGAIHDQGAYGGVNHAVDDYGDVKQQGTDQVYEQVYGQGQTAYAEVLTAFGEVDSQDVHSSAGTAALESYSYAGSGNDSSDQAGCQSVFYQGNGRNGNYRHKNGLADDAYESAYKEYLADGTVG